MNGKTSSSLAPCSFALRTALAAATTLAAVAPCAPHVHARPQDARSQSSRPAEPSKATTQSETAEHYECPMHPSVTSPKPGRCPKCKMELRAVRAEREAGGAAKSGARADAADASAMSIPDVELLDQDGRKVRFYSDLVKNKVVVINFIFTTCTTVCPPLGATFARVQRELGERAGRDVHFISVSVDPVTDTPERLKAWGAKFKAGPAWTLVTGEKPQMDELLRALAASAARREDHTPTVLIGNDARRQWTRAYGLTAPSRIVRIINDAAEGRLTEESKESK